jgi:ribonuclease III
LAPDLAQLESALGHHFTVPELLVRALTHRSLANEQAAAGWQGAGTAPGPSSEKTRLVETAIGTLSFNNMGDNERLEFLGDAVLGLVVAESLYSGHPEWHEGELTRVRAQLVSRQHMALVAEEIELGRHLRLSRGEDKSGLRRKSTVLSNTMEAVIGALFLDGGLEPVRAFARMHVLGKAADQLAQELQSGAALGNFKSALQEHLQAGRAGTPVYRVKSESGPGHRKRFVVEVRLKAEAGEPGKPLARGAGTTKKRAEQDAARRALDRLMAKTAAAEEDLPDEIEEEEAAQ